MARQEVDIGVEGNDGTGDSIRESFRKVNENFREIYAVVGKGGQITFTLLEDTPDSLDPYQGNNQAAYIPIVKQDGSGIEIRKLASNFEGSDGLESDTVSFDVTQEGVVILRTTNIRLQQDNTPALGGPLNAANVVIANIETSQQAIDEWNQIHGGNITLDDIVIDKKFADRNYYERLEAGDELNLPDEPTSSEDYTRIFSVDTTYARISFHQFSAGTIGSAWIYRSSNQYTLNYTNIETDQGAKVEIEGSLTSGDIVYIRPENDDIVSLFLTKEAAQEDDDDLREELRLKLIVPDLADGETLGTQTLTNAEYNPELDGFFLENQAMPRKSIVRRQGDKMEGPLYLSDHPGDLSGAGTIFGQDDLQAVTKLYVDSQSAQSSVNIFVSENGDDKQLISPAGKEGSTLSYAYRTIGAAARKAEEIQIASPFEPGPYLQDIIYTEQVGEGNPPTVTKTQITGAEVAGADLTNIEVKSLVDANKDFIIAEVVAWKDDQIENNRTTTTTIDSDIVSVEWSGKFVDDIFLEQEITKVVDAVLLDYLSGSFVNVLTNRVGFEYYSNLSEKYNKGLSPDIFNTLINQTKIIIENILQNDTELPYINLQEVFDQVFFENTPGDSSDISDIRGKFGNIFRIVNGGVFNANIERTGKRYQINFTNGSNNFVDQGNPQNRDLRIGKVVRGKTSGALGRIVSYTPGNTQDDTLELELLKPIEFINGEHLEYGNLVTSKQITIRVETGTYFEDYPIRVPENVSIKGDEFRRVIIRPQRRTSQSPWADIYFYRDLKFDGLTGDSNSITGIPDNNIPNAGTPYINPLTGEQDGWFGRHYLVDPTRPKNVGASVDNPGGYNKGAKLIEINKRFIQEEVIAWLGTFEFTIPGSFDQNKQDRYRQTVRSVLDALIKDLREGDNINIRTIQGDLFFNTTTETEETYNALGYISTNILQDILANQPFVRDPSIIVGSNHPEQRINENLFPEDGVSDLVVELMDLIRFVVEEDTSYNPAKLASEVDCFLMNDATILRNISVQGHGGFMCVLDPEGQILTKSPYIQTGSSFSQSLNRQAFRGGMLVDAFCANTPLTVEGTVDSDPFRLQVFGTEGSALSLRKPKTPAPFYINGVRYQVNDIIEYDPEGNPSAILVLDETSGPRDINGNYLGWILPTPYDITLQTAGNRSMLGNDFTQVNDLGYGLLVMNGGLSEMVSMFTYYCHAAYYAYNGSQIRSVAGSNANGVYGLIAEGADPNEVPDDVVLQNDMVQEAKTFSSSLVLGFNTNISVTAGDTITQTGQTGSATAVYSTNGRKLFLKDLTGIFVSSGGDIVVNGVTQTGIEPTNLDTTDYSNPENALSLYFYDVDFVPTNKGELDYYHNDDFNGTIIPDGVVARYEIANVEIVDSILVDGYIIDSNDYTYTPTTRSSDPVEELGEEAILTVLKATKNGGEYQAKIFDNRSGFNYKVGDTFTITGDLLNGASPANDVVVEVSEISVSKENQDLGKDVGSILSLNIISGTPNIVPGLTPKRNGQVYKVNFSTSNDDFQGDGLIQPIPENKPITIRSNQNFLLTGIEDAAGLKIRPSTAVNFQEDPDYVYRSISFGQADAIGNPLDNRSSYTGFDSTYDYVRLAVSDEHKGRLGSGIITTGTPITSTTLGATQGDTTVAINTITELKDIKRLNNNSFTSSEFRVIEDEFGNPIDYTNELPMVVSWQGKRHYAVNYREVSISTSYRDQIGYQGVYDNVVTYAVDSIVDYQGFAYIATVETTGNLPTDTNFWDIFPTNFVESSFNADINTYALIDLIDINEVELEVNDLTTFDRLSTPIFEPIEVQIRDATTLATGFVKIAGENTTKIKLYNVNGNFGVGNQLEISFNSGGTWSNLVSTITGTPVVVTSVDNKETNITDYIGSGIAEPLSIITSSVITLRAGLQDGAPATITIQISTCRATGHDFLDIGTGSYNQTNYPNVVLGFPASEPRQENEVQELNKGRVFYVSTDQDGFFRVGRFFTVDQGTGTVTFAAAIALSDVDGIGFKRGVVVTEFSTDTAMSDNAIDSVPTESAVRGYVNRRLGIDQAGNIVPNRLGPSVLVANGIVPMEGDLDMATNRIVDLSPVNPDITGPLEAVPKIYIDENVEAYNKFSKLRDVKIPTASANDILGISGVRILYINANSVDVPFSVDDILTDATVTDNFGTVIGIENIEDQKFGALNVVYYTPGPDLLEQTNPFAEVEFNIYHVQDLQAIEPIGSGVVLSGPHDEVINLSEDSISDISLTITRNQNNTSDPTATYDLQINPGVIVNADVSATAGIAQSKLDMDFADTFTLVTDGGSDTLPLVSDPEATIQATLGLAKFNSESFESTRGWISVTNNGIKLRHIQTLAPDTVIGNSTTNTATPTEVTFSNVVDQGFGIQHSDLPYINDAGVEQTTDFASAGVLTRIGADDYAVNPITTIGLRNSVVKTESDGQITASKFAIGQNNNYTILQTTGTAGTGLSITTPTGGQILTADGTTNPTVNIPGNVDVGTTGISKSSLQSFSTLTNESWIASDWLYTQFIEAANERGNASTGIAIGAGSGKSTSGEVAIVTANTTNNTSSVPFKFSRTGVVPDANGVYNIGGQNLDYNTIYVRTIGRSVSVSGIMSATSVNTRTITTGAAATTGTITGNWSLSTGSRLQATYADLAENYAADAAYEPGTVVVLGGTEEVTVTDQKDDRRVAGVVSTDPAYLMNAYQSGTNVVAVALQGRVPCKVVGRVAKGDILVTSAIPGYACVNNDPKNGTVIGKAISEKTDTDRGVVEVLVGKA